MKNNFIDIKEHDDNTSEYLVLMLLLAVFTSIAFAMVYKVQSKSPGDYLNYYYGSTFLFQGVSADSIYDPLSFNRQITTEGFQHTFSNYAPVPPCSLLFYYPFTLTEFALSKFIFNVISLYFFMFSLYRLCIQESVKPWIVCVVLLTMIYPIYTNFVQGQSYLLILAFLIEGYLCSVKGNGWIASILFAIPIVLKLFPAILLLWLFFTGRKKELLLTTICVIGLSLAVIPFTGIHAWLTYHVSILPRLIGGEINDPFSVTYQSYTVLFKKMFLYDDMLNPSVILHAPWLVYLLNILLGALLINICIQFIQKHREQTLLCFGITFLFGLTISGYGTNYSLILLLFVGLAILNDNRHFSFYKIFLLLLICCIAFFQVAWFTNFPVLLQFGRLFCLFLLLILLIREQQIVWLNTSFFLILFILTIPILIKTIQKKDRSDYYLSYEPSLFITNYDIVPNGICLHYIGKQGMDSILYKSTDQLRASAQLHIKDNQIYEGTKQITFGSDYKKQPAYLNSKGIIYLSDCGRGPGLTTLRKLKRDE